MILHLQGAPVPVAKHCTTCNSHNFLSIHKSGIPWLPSSFIRESFKESLCPASHAPLLCSALWALANFNNSIHIFINLYLLKIWIALNLIYWLLLILTFNFSLMFFENLFVDATCAFAPSLTTKPLVCSLGLFCV